MQQIDYTEVPLEAPVGTLLSVLDSEGLSEVGGMSLPPPEEGNGMKVVVYGTLKKGYSNSHFLKGAELLGPVKVDGFKLFYSSSDRGFPVATPCGESSIMGELYQIPSGNTQMIRSLDGLEGEGFMYNREVVLDEETQMYVGVKEFWRNFEGMVECPQVDGSYVWGRNG